MSGDEHAKRDLGDRVERPERGPTVDEHGGPGGPAGLEVSGR